MKKGIVVGVLLVVTGMAQADTEALNAAALKMCQKAEMCVKQEIANSKEIPPSMRAMVDTMVAQMCSHFTKFTQADQYHEVVGPATACLESMASLSCDVLMDSENETSECKKLEGLAKKYNY